MSLDSDMIIRLFSGFSTQDTGFFAGEAQAASGSSVVTWRSDGQYFIPFGVLNLGSGSYFYSGAVQQLEDDLNGLSLTVPATIWEVRYDNAINRIVISCSNAPYRIEFNASLQRTFGLNQEYFSPQSKVITGSRAPFFVWTSTQERRAKDTHVYERNSFVNERVSDSGIAYSIGRRDVEKRRDWEFQLEPKSNVYAYASSSTEPFTWERFIKNLRERPSPFILMEDVTGSTIYWDDREALYEMRAETMNFRPARTSDTDYHDYWNIPVRTRVHEIRHRDRKEEPPGVAPVYPGLTTLLLPVLGVSRAGDVPTTSEVLSWSAAPNASYYNVFFGIDSSPDSSEFIGTTTNTFFTASVSNTGSHFWKVQAVNDDGLSESSVSEFYVGGSSSLINDIDNVVTSTIYLTGAGGFVEPQTYAQISYFNLGSNPLNIEVFGETEGTKTFEYVLVGGGASGDLGPVGISYAGGGGGAGGVVSGTLVVSSSANVVVGAGGTYGGGKSGGDTTFYGVTASGGTAGGGTGGTSGNGFSGGASGVDSAGGGGGSAEQGQAGGSAGEGGDGGAGLWVVFNEISQAVAGGGGGAGTNSAGQGEDGGGNGAVGAGPAAGNSAGGYGSGGGGGIGLAGSGGAGSAGFGLLQWFIGNVFPVTVSNPTPADTAVSISRALPQLQWSGSLYAEKYEVYFGQDSTPDAGEFLGSTTATSYSLAAQLLLDQTASYYWRIDAVNSHGTSSGEVWEFETEVSECLPAGTASNPTPVSGATNVSVTLTDLSWSAAPSASYYDVYFDQNDPPTTLRGATTTITTWSLAPLLPLNSTSSYYWRIDSINVCGTSSGDVWPFQTEDPSFVPIMASGGTITTESFGGVNHAIHRFTTPGSSSFIVSVSGSSGSVDYVVVGGGGGGAQQGGGGGGGAVLSGSTAITTASYDIVVGVGGVNVIAAVPTQGSASDFDSFATAAGGGYGGWSSGNGNAGGSGGGGGWSGGSGGTGSPGKNGGNANSLSGGSKGSGGGGGMGAAGGNASSTLGGAGGDGVTLDFNNLTGSYGGGGGGSHQGGTGGAGGLGGGGRGGNQSTTEAEDGTPNTGGGGGGTFLNDAGGDGGSGIVIIKYPLVDP